MAYTQTVTMYINLYLQMLKSTSDTCTCCIFQDRGALKHTGA